MFQGFTGWHALVILVVVLLLFGAPKLPALARSLGQSMKIFRSEVKDPKKADAEADGVARSEAAGDIAAGDTVPSEAKDKPGSASSS